MNTIIYVKNPKRKKSLVKLQARRGLHYDGINKTVQGTCHTRLRQLPSHTAYTHSSTQPRVLFYTLYTFKRNKRHSPSLTLSILSIETSENLQALDAWILF